MTDESPDPRSRPHRGVRVKPLPRIMHPIFRRFVADLDKLAQSHLSTWKLAERSCGEFPQVNANLIYWSSVRRFLNHLEYLGTTNDPGSRRRSPPDNAR